MENIIYLNMVEKELNHWWFKGRREIITKFLSPYLSNNMEILDAGCGAGGTMEVMTKYGMVTGVDTSEEMIDYCQKKGLNANCHSILDLPFDDSTFDLVLCLDVIEHLPDEEPAILELMRVLKPGGLLLLSVPSFGWLWGRHDELNNHYRRYNYGVLSRTVQKAGFKEERSTYFNFFLLPAVFLIRKISKLLPVQSNNTDFQFGTGLLGSLLYLTLKIESCYLRYMRFPIGVSQLMLVRK